MTPPRFAFISRTAPLLPGEIFVGGRSHSFVPLVRHALGYEAVFDPDQRSLIEDKQARRNGIAVRDLDAPTVSPRFLDVAGNWLHRAGEPTLPPTSALASLSFSAEPPWPLASITASVLSLAQLGIEEGVIARAVSLELTDQVVEQIEARVCMAIRQGADGIATALYEIGRDRCGKEPDRALIGRRGEAFAAMLRNLEWFGPSAARQTGPAQVLPGAGWWPRVEDAEEWWMSYSATLVLRPGRAGDWRMTAHRSSDDPRIQIRRWKVAADVACDRLELSDKADALTIALTSLTGAPVLIELEAERFFVASHSGLGTENDRSLALCFANLSMEPV